MQPEFSDPKAYEVSGGMPDLIQVQYDVSEAKVRNKLRHVLKSEGFQDQTLSVYLGKYSPELMDRVREIASVGKARIRYMTPKLPSDELANWLAFYEQRYQEDFSELHKVLAVTEKMLADDELKVDEIEIRDGNEVTVQKKERPYTAKEIQQRLKRARYDLGELSSALEKRKMREKNTDPEIFDHMGLRLREIDAFIERLDTACTQRRLRETQATAAQTQDQTQQQQEPQKADAENDGGAPIQ